MHQIGAALLEMLLNVDSGGYLGARIDCPNGHRARFVKSNRAACCYAGLFWKN